MPNPHGWTKLFSTLVTSTIWQEPNEVKVIWVTILATKGRDHICRATIPYLAKVADITTDRCAEIVESFQQPDPYSRNAEHEGRRIERVPEGWLVLNSQKYRDDGAEEDNRVKTRERMRIMRQNNAQPGNQKKK